jgi:catechol 2,3-dioxygenase-like lactoylglutathione lyase family enzyme
MWIRKKHLQPESFQFGPLVRTSYAFPVWEHNELAGSASPSVISERLVASRYQTFGVLKLHFFGKGVVQIVLSLLIGHNRRQAQIRKHRKAAERRLSELEMSMSGVQIEQKSYEMPPREGISIAHFLTVADVERSARYYEKVFGARILTMGDGNAPPYLQLANIWMILNVGGGPTPDKPTVTLSVPDPNHINSFMNFRVADIQACYELWKSRGAEFLTEPIAKYGEIRCYIRDPDGYIIEVGQSTDLKYG